MAQQTIHLGLKIDADTSSAKASLDQLHQELNKLQTQNFELGGLDKEFKEAATAAKELQTHLLNATNKFGQIDIGKFSQSMQQSNTSVKQLSTAFLNAGKQGQAAFAGLANQIINAQKPALSFSNILTKMGTTLANNIRWQISSSAINAFTGSIQDAWRYTKDMDTALTNIRVVTGKSKEEMDKLAAASNKMAKELKTTTAEMVKGQLIYYQQGDSAALAAEKARITAMAANVSFESSQEEMAEYLTAIWNSYQVGESELELFVDKLSAVGAATATSMEEIATGMTKVAASANAVGVTYDQLNATIATISSTTRVSAESVGTAMKTIYARMGDLKVGKTDEDGITYGQVSSTMKRMGIDIADANGQLRDMGEVVEEIGDKWETFSKEEQQALVQAVAGKRQYTNLTALFENWDMYLKTLETSANAMGTLQEQQDAWADSWEGASNRVKASLESLYQHTLDSDAFIGGANAFAGFLDGLDWVIEKSGGLESVLLNVGGLLVHVFNAQISAKFADSIDNIRIIFGGWEKELIRMRNGLAELPKTYPDFDNLSSSLKNTVTDFAKLATVENIYLKNQGKMTTAQKTQYNHRKMIIEGLQEERQKLEEASAEHEKYIRSLGKSKTTVFKAGRGSVDDIDRNKIVTQAFNGDNTKASEFLNLSRKNISKMNGQVSELGNTLKRIAKNYNIELGLEDDEQDAKKVRDALNQLIRELKIPVPDFNFNLKDDIQTSKSALETFTNEFKEMDTESTVTVGKVKQSFTTLGTSLGMTQKDLDELFDGFLKEADDVEVNLGQITQKLNEFTAKKVDKVMKIIDPADEDEAERIRIALSEIFGANGDILNKNGQINSSFKLMGENVTNVKSGIVGLASALMSGASAGMSITSALDSFTNGDITSSIMGAASAVSSLISSLITAFSSAGWIGLIISALMTGISLWQKYHKTAEEKIQDLNGELETLKGEIESLNGELTTTRDRISELQSKGTLSLVEQKELDRCLQQEASLERQVRLKEQLEGEKNKEKSLTWIEDNKDNQKSYRGNVRKETYDKAQSRGGYVREEELTDEEKNSGTKYYVRKLGMGLEARDTEEQRQKRLSEGVDDYIAVEYQFELENIKYGKSLEEIKQQVKEMEEAGIGYIENATQNWQKEQNKMVLNAYRELFKGLADEARSKGDIVGYAQNISDAINEEILHNPELQNFPKQISNLLTPEGALKDTIKIFSDLPVGVQGSLNKFKDLGIDVEKHWKDIILGMNNGILSLDTKTFTSDLDFMIETVSKKTNNLKDILADFKPEKGFTNEQQFSILEMFPTLTSEELVEWEKQLKDGGQKALDGFFNWLKNKDFDAIKYTFDIEVAANWDENKIKEIANAFGVAETEVRELQEAYHLLADNGIAYAVKAADGSITYYKKTGEAITDLGGEVDNTTAYMIALNQELIDASKLPNLPPSIRQAIIDAGTAAGWSNGKINGLMTAMNNLNNVDVDMSTLIADLQTVATQAGTTMSILLGFNGISISTYGDDFVGPLPNGTIDTGLNTKVLVKKGNTPLTVGQFKEELSNIYSDLYKNTTPGGSTGPGVTNPSGGGGGGGDEKSPKQKNYEATKKKYEDDIKQAEADLKADGNYAKYRQTVETAWSDLVTAFQGLSPEEKEAAKSEMQSASLGVKEVIAGYFDNIAEEWKEGYEQAEDEFGSEKAGMIADLEASAQAGLATLLKEGASKDLWDVYHKVLESSKDENLPQEIRTYLETRRQEIWNVLQGLEKDFEDYNILDFWTNLEIQMLQNDKNITGEQWKEFFNKKLESLRQQLRDGKISVEEFHKEWEDTVNAGYYNCDLGKLLPVFSFDERQDLSSFNELQRQIEDITSEINELQNAKETLANAVEEFNENNGFSIDTFNNLMQIEPQYLNLLFDENGQINLNTEAIDKMTKARLRDLAVMKAIQTVDLIKKYQDEGKSIDDILETKITSPENATEYVIQYARELIKNNMSDEQWQSTKKLLTGIVGSSDKVIINPEVEVPEKSIEKIKELKSSYEDLINVQQTLAKAYQEYSSGLGLSMETFSALMELHPKYLAMLFDENGQISLNTDSINKMTKAYREQMAMQKAQEIINLAIRLKNNAEDGKIAWDELENAVGGSEMTWENIRKKINELGLPPELKEQIEQYIDNLEDLANTTGDIAEGFNEQGKSVSNYITELDNLQSVFSSLKAIIEEYNKNGAISVDNFEKILQLNPAYLKFLIDEEGQLQLNEEAFYQAAEAAIRFAAMQRIVDTLDHLISLGDAADEFLKYSLSVDGAADSLTGFVDALLQTGKYKGKLTDSQIELFKENISNPIIQLAEGAIAGLRKGGMDNTFEDKKTTEENDAKEARERERRILKKKYEAGEITAETYYDELSKITMRDAGTEILTNEEASEESKEDALFLAEVQRKKWREDLEKGLIDYATYKEKIEEIASRGTYDYELGRILPIYSIEEREEIDQELKNDDVKAQADYIANAVEKERLDGLKGATQILTLSKTIGIDEDVAYDLKDESISMAFDSINKIIEEGGESYSESLKKLRDIVYDDTLTEEQRKNAIDQLRKSTESSVDKFIENIEHQPWRLSVAWNGTIDEFEKIIKEGTGIDFSSLTREEFLSLDIDSEDKDIAVNSIKSFLSFQEEQLNNGIINWETFWKNRQETVGKYGAALTEGEKQMYLNEEKAAEDFANNLKSRYNNGELTAKQYIERIKSITGVDDYFKKNEIFAVLNSEIDEFYKRLEDGSITTLSDYMSNVKQELLDAGLWATEWGNEIWNEALAKGTSYTSSKYKAEYDNLIAQQILSDWGMTENVNNAAEYKMPYAQKWYEQEKANLDYYVANWKGTGSILDDEGYQAQIANVQAAKDNLKGLADEHLQFSFDWIDHEKSMGRLTLAEETAAYQRIRKNLEEQFSELSLIDAEDAINWYKEQSAKLRQAEIDSRKAEADQYADILKERLEDEKAYYENLKSIREKSFDASQTIRESQHELNLELQKSLTMYEYLDEETRKLIFNEEDYVALTKELSSIQTEINDLTSTYESKIASATTEEAELLTAEYEAQVELKLKEFEIAKANLEITKKQMALQNALNERNTRMFINGQWTWVANQEEVAKAREELAEAEFNAETATLEYQHEQAMNQLDNAINDIQRDVNKIDKALEDLEKVINGTDGLTVTLEDLDKVVEDTIKYIKNSKNADKVVKIGDGYLTNSEWDAVQKEAKSVSNSKNQINPVTGKPYVTDKLGYAIVNGIRVKLNAEGDIVNRPTISMVGEDGPEAIIPLSPKYRDRGLSLWEEATKALGVAPSFIMPTIRTSFPQQKENMNVSQTINVTVQNEDSSNDFYAITNLL